MCHFKQKTEANFDRIVRYGFCMTLNCNFLVTNLHGMPLNWFWREESEQQQVRIPETTIIRPPPSRRRRSCKRPRYMCCSASNRIRNTLDFNATLLINGVHVHYIDEVSDLFGSFFIQLLYTFLFTRHLHRRRRELRDARQHFKS